MGWKFLNIAELTADLNSELYYKSIENEKKLQ